jgi:hypothetical protein
MSRMKDLLLDALEAGEPVPGWPPAFRPQPPEAPRTPLGSVPLDSPRHFWPYHVWMKVGLTPYTRPTTKRGRRRRHYWAVRPMHRFVSFALVEFAEKRT